jgi:hypothetical protein
LVPSLTSQPPAENVEKYQQVSPFDMTSEKFSKLVSAPDRVKPICLLGICASLD